MQIKPKYKEGQFVILLHEEEPTEWMVTAYIIESGVLLYRINKGHECLIVKHYEIEETINYS